MPKQASHTAEQLLTYKGVTVYHVYKYDDVDDCPREWWFDTAENSRDDKAFDVRELAVRLNVDGSEMEDDEAFTVAVIHAGIDAGLIRTRKTA